MAGVDARRYTVEGDSKSTNQVGKKWNEERVERDSIPSCW